MGGIGIKVPLEDEEYRQSFEEAVRTYRALSENSVNQGYIFMKLEPGKQVYKLPENVDTVKGVRRSRAGLIVGQQFEPFSAAFIQQTFGAAFNTAGMTPLVNYEVLMQYQELLGRMFGEFIPCEFNEGTSELTLYRIPKGDEEDVAIDVSAYKDEKTLLADSHAYRWLAKYTEACCRSILGEKYGKYAVIPGAQAGTTLRGGDLIQEGHDMKEKLEDDLMNYIDGGDPLFPFIG
jgi:hypothetical protein